MSHTDTIVAQATPPGRGGVGIVRISGNKVTAIAEPLIGALPKPRYAECKKFIDVDDSVIDMGLALFFPGPNSFTGEDVLELHGHGGPVVQDRLINCIVNLGARIARPGEFSERAFLNDKIDLTQAEAIADLIDSSSEQAARSAVRSLQGEFSQYVNQLVESLIHLRMYVEAAIDFPEEEIDFLADDKVGNHLNTLIDEIGALQNKARLGCVLREGITIVISGKPNAGKSTLLNALSGRDSAIVTDIPGTTRDVMREHINIDGIPLHIIDTAGLRHSDDVIEQEGVRRAQQEIEQADRVLLLTEHMDVANKTPKEILADYKDVLPNNVALSIVHTKIDLAETAPSIDTVDEHTVIKLSAKTGQGLDLLRQHLKHIVGVDGNTEGNFIARRRHLDALSRALDILNAGKHQLTEHKAGELLAEDLRQAQKTLSEITGEFTSDDLLGEIFSSFCIGK